MEESALIKGIQQGDRQSFRVLVESYQQMVINTCLGIVHNWQDAEDLAQDVFVEVFRNSGNFRGDARLSTWLYRIAVNRSLNFVRNNKHRRFWQTIGETFTGGRNIHYEISHSRNDQPDQGITELQRKELLHRAIDQLPEKQRIAFILNKYEDLSYRQVAEVMKMSLASVESLIHRAKRNLQDRLYECYKRNCL